MTHSDAPTSDTPTGDDHARDRLLRAACDLLTELPLDEITVRRIAERAGLVHSLVTRHYGSRQRLLTVAISRSLIDLAARIRAAPNVHVALESAFDQVMHSRELTSSINIATVASTDVEDEARGFPVADAFAGHLTALGVDPRRAQELAGTVTLMIFSWAGAEHRSLAMTGHANDPVAGRAAFVHTLDALIRSSVAEVTSVRTGATR
jgi:AcrR family transcriptional regulator